MELNIENFIYRLQESRERLQNYTTVFDRGGVAGLERAQNILLEEIQEQKEEDEIAPYRKFFPQKEDE